MATKEPRRSSTLDWKISFRLSTVLLGCVFASITFATLAVLLLLTAPDQQLMSDANTTALQIGLMIGGLGTLLIFLVGPSTAYFVGHLLRKTGNQGLHVLAFGAAGALLGAMVGWSTFGASSVSILAALLGISAMVARALVSPYAQR
jgi:hypothetical protein